MPRRILVLYAHPRPDRSQVNAAMAEVARALEGVTLVDLYGLYPTLDIDIQAEQARLLHHDALVFLHPLYWYSSPAILKEWQDLVLEYGWAYGTGGRALAGKIFFQATSSGGASDAYRPGGMNEYPLTTLLSPFERTAKLCHMHWLPPFVLHKAGRALADGRLAHHLDDWRVLLMMLREGTLDLNQAGEGLRPLALPGVEA